jgi:hypothetical protein
MNNNPRNNREDHFDFAGDKPPMNNVQQVSQNMANIDSMIQNSEMPIRGRRSSHAMHDNPPIDRNLQPNHNMNMGPEQDFRQEHDPRRPSGDIQRNPGFEDGSGQMRDMHQDDGFKGHPGRPGMPGKHGSGGQMEMMHREDQRQGVQYYQGQGYHKMSEGHPMSQMRGDMGIQGGYPQPGVPKNEVYSQMNMTRQYPPKQNYQNPQMPGGYYDAHAMQVNNSGIPQETYEKIRNLEKVYFDVLNERVKIDMINNQWMANYRGTNVPINQMNEYITNMQKTAQHQNYRRNEYYMPQQGHQEYHMDPIASRMTPAYEDSQVSMPYGYAPQNRMGYPQYHHSKFDLLISIN